MVVLDEIWARIGELDHAYANNDADTYFSFFAEDATIFVPGLGRWSKADYVEKWKGVLSKGGKVTGTALKDLRVAASPSGDAAIATYVMDVTYRGLSPALSIDQDDDKTLLMTEVWFQHAGSWTIAHMDWSTVEKR